ncbi:recombinase family protein [Candidatus Peribacteria bacterium]|nr:recombinase family protein [Candidatus Peribacteria bacterium]
MPSPKKEWIYRDEGESGASDERPAFKRLLQDAVDKKFDLVLVWKIDRFFRKLEYLLRYVKFLGEHEVQFKSATEQFDTSAVGKLVFQMMGALAEFERELILQRTMEGKMTKAKEGKYVGGSIPYGYDVDEETQTLVINEKEASIVRKMFIREIFKREHYIGRYYYNRYTRDKKTRKNIEKPKSEWQKYDCAPIIDEPIFKRAKERLKENKAKSGGRKNDYLFTGKIWCGEDGCGLKYTGYKAGKGTKNYRCKNKGSGTPFKCPSHGISEEILDGIVWQYVEPFFRNPRKLLEKMIADQRKPEEIEAINLRIKNITTEIARLAEGEKTVKELVRRGTYTPDEVALDLEIIIKEIADFKDEREVLSGKLVTEEQKQEKLFSIERATRKYRKNFEALTYDEKRELYFEIIKKIKIKGNDISIDLWFPSPNEDSDGGIKTPPNTPKTPQGGSDNLCDVNGG